MTRNLTLVRIGAVALLAVAIAACAPDGPDAPGAAGAAAAPDGAAAAATSDMLEPGATVEFVATEFMFAPKDFTAAPGTYKGVLVNNGTVQHDITFEGTDPIVAAAGESVDFEFEVPAAGVRTGARFPDTRTPAWSAPSVRVPMSRPSLPQATPRWPTGTPPQEQSRWRSRTPMPPRTRCVIRIRRPAAWATA